MIAGLLLAAAAAVGIIKDINPADGSRAVFRVPDAPAGSVFTLHRLDPFENTAGPAMFARVETVDGALVLTPSVPLSRSGVYRAVLKLPDGSSVTSDHMVPAGKTEVPRLEKIYPTPKELPANVLKFYLYFSTSMREGSDIFQSFHIEDEAGKRVESPWREQELWDSEARRLTLWIHPGRVKQGVNLREELGPVLLPGREYSLVIDGNLRSATGAPLGQEVRHRFRTLPEDHERPMPESWTLSAPPAGTKEPLRITSREPLDHALLQRYLYIRDANRRKLEAAIAVEPGETAWTLTPAEPWRAEPHLLFIGNMLEDLAGNTRERVFDTDLEEATPAPGKGMLEFTPR